MLTRFLRIRMVTLRTTATLKEGRRRGVATVDEFVTKKEDRRRKRGLLRKEADVAEFKAALGKGSVEDEEMIYKWILNYAEHMNKTSGFFEPQLLPVYWRIFLKQREEACTGAVGEIGVFRGQSFLPLWAMRREHEAAVGVDLFEENQDLNRDNSGSGSKQAVEKAMRRFPLPSGQCAGITTILSADSGSMTPGQLLDCTKKQRFRLFSIDGCHNADAVEHDLDIVSSVMVPRNGVIIMDDVFNSDWPGVVSGLVSFMQRSPSCQCSACAEVRGEQGGEDEVCSTWVPFMLGYNKCFLCLKTDHHLWSSLMPLHQQGVTGSEKVRKTSTFLGHKVNILRQGWMAAFHGNEDVAEMRR